MALWNEGIRIENVAMVGIGQQACKFNLPHCSRTDFARFTGSSDLSQSIASPGGGHRARRCGEEDSLAMRGAEWYQVVSNTQHHATTPNGGRSQVSLPLQAVTQ